jgi:hypothetical protein
MAEISRKIRTKRSGELVVSRCQKIGISGRAIPLLCPKLEKQSAFQNEDFSILRFAKAKENSLEAVLGEYESEVLIPLSREVQEFLSNRGGNILELRIAQARATPDRAA